MPAKEAINRGHGTLLANLNLTAFFLGGGAGDLKATHLTACP